MTLLTIRNSQYASTLFPVLAPLPVARNAAAVAFFAFCRTFAQVSIFYTVRRVEVDQILSRRRGASPWQE